MGIDATIGGAGSDSYITLVQASSYHADSVYGSAWAAYSSGQQELAAKTATRMLDDYVEWDGYKADSDQALRWPRFGMADRDNDSFESTEIPPFLINATSEFAKYLLDNLGTDITAAEGTKGFKALQVDTLKLEVDKDDRDAGSVIPESVIVMVESYGQIRTKSGDGTADVVRH